MTFAHRMAVALALLAVLLAAAIWRGETLRHEPRPQYQPTAAEMAAHQAYYSTLETTTEIALYSQNQLLARALSAIKPGDPDTIELFFLGVAGDGSQEVFRREVEFVRDRLDADFGTAGRSLILANSRTSTNRLPLATATGLKRALQGLAAVMNREQDVLFLYLTSHGSEQHELAIQHAGITLPDLPAETLADMLGKLPIKWKVIVISACFSGGFIEPLRDEHTLIITASRDDRPSFGCSDEADMTYFGRAYFREALPRADSFVDAYERARVHIRKWEKDFDTHSLPQIHAPETVTDYLDQWAAANSIFQASRPSHLSQ